MAVSTYQTGYVLRRYFMTNSVRIGANFRDFKVIDHISVDYFWSVHPLTVTSSVTWQCIHFEMYVTTV